MNAKNTHAFTLIELLVVIAIIAILAAILFPVFATAREKARQSTCASNQKQIGIAMLQYIQDYDETTPLPNFCQYFGASWQTTPNYLGSLVPYIKQKAVFACPSVAKVATDAYDAPSPDCDTTYIGVTTVLGIPVSKIPAVSNTIYLWEGSQHQNTTILGPQTSLGVSSCYWWHSTSITSVSAEASGTAHNGSGNNLFCDGHVKFLAVTQLRSGMFGMSPDQPYSLTNGNLPDAPTPTYNWQRAF